MDSQEDSRFRPAEVLGDGVVKRGVHSKVPGVQVPAFGLACAFRLSASLRKGISTVEGINRQDNV